MIHEVSARMNMMRRITVVLIPAVGLAGCGGTVVKQQVTVHHSHHRAVTYSASYHAGYNCAGPNVSLYGRSGAVAHCLEMNASLVGPGRLYPNRSDYIKGAKQGAKDW